MSRVLGWAAVAALASLSWTAGPAAAQVVYAPNGAPVYYGYPVPGGVLQPNEALGTSPSFEIFPDPYGRGPAVRVLQRCQYPNGWNVTDFGRDLNGIPNGVEHTCPVARVPRLRARY